KKRGLLLEAILYCATTEQKPMLPTIEQFVLSELVNGTIQYSGGNAGKLNYQMFLAEPKAFERSMWQYYHQQAAKGKLSQDVYDSITTLVKYKMVNAGGPDKPFAQTELYTHFKGGAGYEICPVTFSSIFSLPYKTVLRVRNTTLPSYSRKEKEHVEGIGAAMRPFIEQDMEFIKKTYCW
ncbi:MAG: hypothetical protein ABIF10_05795, partial [Candidatus Woesearchaeota archaeon]